MLGFTQESAQWEIIDPWPTEFDPVALDRLADRVLEWATTTYESSKITVIASDAQEDSLEAFLPAHPLGRDDMPLLESLPIIDTVHPVFCRADTHKIVVIGDESGKIRVTIWNASTAPMIEEGEQVRIHGTARNWYQGRVSLAVTGWSTLHFPERGRWWGWPVVPDLFFATCHPDPHRVSTRLFSSIPRPPAVETHTVTTVRLTRGGAPRSGRSALRSTRGTPQR